MPTAGRPTLSPAHGMVYRIHRNASDLRPSSQPSFPAGLSKIDILMGHIAQLPDGGFAFYQNHTNFPRGQLNLGITIFLGHQLGISAGTAHNLPTLAKSQFNIMNLCSQRYVAERQGIARLNVGIGT